MDDDRPHSGLSEADGDALSDLRAAKGRIEAQMVDESLPAHVRGRMTTEYRHFVLAIREIEVGAGRSDLTYSIVDELRDKRAARRLAQSDAAAED